jgi:tagatose 1,6-diphosphate aldolase
MISEAKARRLDAISTASGVIAAVAMDQRRSLRGMIARAAGTTPDAIPDAQLVEFKAAVTEHLSPHASAILLDPEYGLDGARRKSPNCGLLLTYESDGFENPRPHRMLALMPHISVRRLRDLGASAIKILLSYAPDDSCAANDVKHAAIERIGAECEALDMPFLLEPVVYHPATGSVDPRDKPELVVHTMRQFSRPDYRVDILKVEFPIGFDHLWKAYSRHEALDWYKRADDAASGMPYLYLSAGVSIRNFIGSLELALESGAHFSGVLCGRALWQDGIPHYSRGGVASFAEWLQSEGVRNVNEIQSRLHAATPWRKVAR